MNLLVELGLTLLIQSTIVGSAAILLATLLRKKGAAWQTAVYRYSLAGIVGLMVFSPLSQINTRTLWQVSTPPEGPMMSLPALPLPKLAKTEVPSLPQPPAMDTMKVLFPVADSVTESLPTTISARDIVIGAWIGGALLLLAWIGLGQLGLWGLRKSGQPAELITNSLLRDLSGSLGLATPDLIVSQQVHSPFVGGIRKPTIFLPAAFEESTEVEDLRAVLCHELCHILHRDGGWRMLGRLLCAILWPQPLFWILLRRMEDAGEELSDQRVLQTGFTPSGYAKCLVHIADGLRPTRMEQALGLGVVRVQSSLSKRIGEILRFSNRDLRVSRKVRTVLGIGAFATVLIAVSLVSAKGAAMIQERLDPRAWMQRSLRTLVSLKTYSATCTVSGRTPTSYDIAYSNPDTSHIVRYRKGKVTGEAYTRPKQVIILNPSNPSKYEVYEQPWMQVTQTPLMKAGFHLNLMSRLPLLFWKSYYLATGAASTSRDATVYSFGPDGIVDGVPVKQVIAREHVHSKIVDGGIDGVTLFDIGKKDFLIRRITTRQFIKGKPQYEIVETFTNVKANGPIPAEKLTFRPKAGATATSDSLPAASARETLARMATALKNAPLMSFEVEGEYTVESSSQPVATNSTKLMKVTMTRPLKNAKINIVDAKRKGVRSITSDEKSLRITEASGQSKMISASLPNVWAHADPDHQFPTSLALLNGFLTGKSSLPLEGTLEARSPTVASNGLSNVVVVKSSKGESSKEAIFVMDQQSHLPSKACIKTVTRKPNGETVTMTQVESFNYDAVATIIRPGQPSKRPAR